MHGRCLTRGTGNVIDIDIFTRDNNHYYDVFVYGFQQEKDLSANIIMHSGLSDLSGLKLGLVKPNKISDIDYLLISDIENKTIDEICYTRIY